MYMDISLEEKRRYWDAGPEGPFPPVDRTSTEFVKERLRLLVVDYDAQKEKEKEKGVRACPGAEVGADAAADAAADHVREVFKDKQVSHFTALFVDEEAVDSVLRDGQKGFVGAVEVNCSLENALLGKYRWPGWLRVQLSTLYAFYTSAASADGSAFDARRRDHTTAPVYDEDRGDYDSEGFDVSTPLV